MIQGGLMVGSELNTDLDDYLSRQIAAGAVAPDLIESSWLDRVGKGLEDSLKSVDDWLGKTNTAIDANEEALQRTANIGGLLGKLAGRFGSKKGQQIGTAIAEGASRASDQTNADVLFDVVKGVDSERKKRKDKKRRDEADRRGSSRRRRSRGSGSSTRQRRTSRRRSDR